MRRTITFTTSDIFFFNGERTAVTPAPTESVAFWVVCSFNVARTESVFKSSAKTHHRVNHLPLMELKRQKHCRRKSETSYKCGIYILVLFHVSLLGQKRLRRAGLIVSHRKCSAVRSTIFPLRCSGTDVERKYSSKVFVVKYSTCVNAQTCVCV